MNDGGFPLLAKRAVNKYAPEVSKNYNGVKVRDQVFNEDEPEYEDALTTCISSWVKQGDEVVLVGAGYGVSTVYASQSAGSEGYVTVFEASEEMLEKCRETVQLNNCVNVELQQALFYESKAVWGSFSDAERLEAEYLPKCDVLVLDCEGVEDKIIQNLDFRPRTIIVETHEQFDCPKTAVMQILDNEDFSIKASFVDSKEQGTDVIVAERRGGGDAS